MTMKKKKVLRVCSVTKSCPNLFSTLWTVPCQAALPMEFSRPENWVGCHFLLQGESSWSQDRACISCGSCIGKEPGNTFSHLGSILVTLIIAVLLFYFIFLNFILFLNFTILYWFCQISKWICHRYTCVPHSEPSSLLPPHTIPLGRPSAPAPSIQYRASNLDWRLVSYMILYIFQCHSPKSSHPLPLPQSP